MRAIKRERYGKKELEMLKQTVGAINNTKDQEIKEIYKGTNYNKLECHFIESDILYKYLNWYECKWIHEKKV